jgi:hypothetical protein
MAQFGEYGGPIKKTMTAQTQAAANGSNVSVTITHEDQSGDISSMKVACLVTTSGNAFVEVGAASTASSLALTSSDSLICSIPSGGILGVWGNGGTPTITIKKFVC